MIENPVRARLTEHPRDYPFLGSERYTLSEMIDFAYGPEVHGKGSG